MIPGINEALVPRSQAKNAYELLDEIKAVITAEPKRINMDNWLFDPKDVPEPSRPACGTVACIAGWTCLLVDGVEKTVLASGLIGKPVFSVSVPARAAELLGGAIELEDEDGMLRTLFDAEVEDTDGSPLDSGDLEYVPAVIARIEDFQQQHQPRLLATPIVTTAL
jgi:hypothetical protein